MNTNCEDFVTKVERANLALFRSKKITITPENLRVVIRSAFEAGRKFGVKEGKETKSLFESIFGKY